MNEFENIVTNEQQLREIVGMPGARTLQKERAALDAHCRAFIALSPLVLMATAGSDGHCDVSPKGDAAGFVLVLDDRGPGPMRCRRWDAYCSIRFGPTGSQCRSTSATSRSARSASIDF